jgi:hypothetical protein
MKPFLCHKLTPSREMSKIDCKVSYKTAIDNPGDESMAVCASCERGKTLFFSPANRKGMFTMAKPCTKGCGKGAVRDGLCTKCYRKEHGVLPYPKKKTDKKIAKASKTRKVHKSAKVIGGNGSAQKPENMVISVDFSSHPEICLQLEKNAREEHRTLDLQVLHIVAQKFKVEEITGPLKAARPANGIKRG